MKESADVFFFKKLEELIKTRYLCSSKAVRMFEFDQYLGFLAFLTILTIGFWLMMFLLLFVVPYWLGGNLLELWKERREAKRAKREA
jgi:hypothetical protein